MQFWLRVEAIRNWSGTNLPTWFVVHGEKSQPVSCRPTMVLLVAVLSSLVALSMCYPTCRSVSVGWYGKPFEEIFIQCNASIGIGDIFWCHSLAGGDVDISSRPRLMWNQQALDHSDIKLLRRWAMWWIGIYEYIVRLKRERRRSLKLSPLDFFLCFIAFSPLYLWNCSFDV